MIEFLGILGFGIGCYMTGYFIGNKRPLMKPEKEIVYVRPQEFTRGEHRIMPEHPPIAPKQ